MTPVDFQRRHCAACDRTLTDFTAMTDVEIGRHLRRNPGKLCGRFNISQLNRKLALNGRRRYGGLRAAAAAAGLLLTAPVTAQEVIPLKTELNLHVERLTTEVDVVKNVQLGSRQDTTIIKGVITDPSGETLIGASVLIKGTTIGTTTDIDGNFSLPVSTNSSISLLVQYTGFRNTEHQITNGELLRAALLNDSLELDEIICEESAVGYVSVNKYISLHDLVAPVRRYVIWPVRKAVRNISDWRRGRFDRREARQLCRAERQAGRVDKVQDLPMLPETQASVTTLAKEVAPETLNFKASPNPFNDHLRVAFSLDEGGAYRLELYDVSGKKLGYWEGVGEAGPQEKVLEQELNGLPAGMYFLELTTKTSASVLTLVR